MAWFTQKEIFDRLVEQAKEDCKVLLIISNDEINQNSAIDYERLNIRQSKVFKIGDGKQDLMHNKFCVIDNRIVITGSYNWSYKAESNYENITITKDDQALAKQFIAEFNNIRKKYFPNKIEEDEIILPLEKVTKRLEIIKNFILLEETDAIHNVVEKLKRYRFNEAINEIINKVETKDYATAIEHIQKFISQKQQLTTWEDPEIEVLKLEIKNLENQLNSYDNKRIELEKLLTDFNHRHAQEVGDLIVEILSLKKLLYKDDKEKYEKAERDEKEYKKQVENESKKQIYELDEQEQQDIKKKFREATFFCHPDKVADKYKKEASETFNELKAAYDANDIKKVNEIYEELKNGNFYKTNSETVNEKAALKSSISKLKRKIEQLKTTIIEIKESDTYQKIKDIDDWDEYFTNLKEQLSAELERLKEELNVQF